MHHKNRQRRRMPASRCSRGDSAAPGTRPRRADAIGRQSRRSLSKFEALTRQRQGSGPAVARSAGP